MWHTVFTAPSTASGPVTAEFEFFLADSSGLTPVDYTTTAGVEAGFDTTTTQLTFDAIPEPSAALLFLVGIGFLTHTRRTRHARQP